jgi:hypothetical protein
MPGWAWAIVGVAMALALIGVAVALLRQRRTARLREGFGPEYRRAVAERGDRREAERELVAREQRRDSFDIRPLSAPERERYAEAWRAVQAGFVDRPTESVGEADRLIQRVMADRGYPVGEFEQRSADLSVDHPGVVEHYRAAHGISEATAAGESSTEDLRRAMVHYRALFVDLLDERDPTPVEGGRR